MRNLALQVAQIHQVMIAQYNLTNSAGSEI